MTDFFYDCHDLKSGKKKYAELAKKLHPDKGGSNQEMQKLNAAWESFQQEIESNGNSDFESNSFFNNKYHRNNNEKESDYVYSTLKSRIRDLSNEICHLKLLLEDAERKIKNLEEKNREFEANSLLSDERVFRICRMIFFWILFMLAGKLYFDWLR